MDAPSDEPPRWRLVLGSALAAVLCAAVLLCTSPGLPMVWDEGNAILRAEGIARWVGRWFDDREPGPLDQRAIAEDWPYTTSREGHPALYGIVIAAGTGVSGAWLEPLQAARFGPVMLFALAAGAMGYRLWREYSVGAAVGAVTALIVVPRLFAHAHFASFDGPLTACWVLAWAAFAPACRRWPMAVPWGIALGMTLSCKATGWIAPVPFLVWAAVYRDRSALKALAVGLPVALVTFFALNPPLWHHPIDGPVEFFRLNLHRAADPGLNVSTWFLGRMYNLDYPLPWYNTLFWTAVTVPIGILIAAGVGVVSLWRRRRVDRTGTLLAAHWLVLLLVRALPGAPPHDGVRLFLPAFAFLAALAGVGCAVLMGWAKRRWPSRALPRWATLGVIFLFYDGAAANLFLYTPQWLSYYNPLIGGLPGATRAGMEPTYYWDGLDRSVLDWLHTNSRPEDVICFAAASPENLLLMRHWQTLRCRTVLADDDPGRFRWYVLQRRPSGWQPVDRWLVHYAEPAHQKTLLGEPLVEVYGYEEYLRARKEVSRKAAKTQSTER